MAGNYKRKSEALTDREIAMIVKLRTQPFDRPTTEALGKRFGVSATHISRIVNRRKR
jgi:hypothetical protein